MTSLRFDESVVIDFLLLLLKHHYKRCRAALQLFSAAERPKGRKSAFFAETEKQALFSSGFVIK